MQIYIALSIYVPSKKRKRWAAASALWPECIKRPLSPSVDQEYEYDIRN